MIQTMLRKVMVPLGVLALALVIMLAAPKAAHAVVATLVQVVNTSANPVPNADVNAPGAEPFNTILCFASPSQSPCGLQPLSTFVPGYTADGLSIKRAVIKTVSAFCKYPAGGTTVAGLETTTLGQPFFLNLPPTLVSSIGGTNITVSTIPVEIYVDPNSTINTAFYLDGGGSVYCGIGISGYYLTH